MPSVIIYVTEWTDTMRGHDTIRFRGLVVALTVDFGGNADMNNTCTGTGVIPIVTPESVVLVE